MMNGLARKIRNGFIKLGLKHKPLESAFTYIYANNSWGHKESVSGHGSSLEKTAQIRRELPAVLKMYGIRSVFDAPCGDFHWMKELDLAGVDYIGGDIVKALIESNQKKYGSASKRFLKIDVTRTTPPKADLILCRDLFIHLPLADCQRAVARFTGSNSTYLLATTYIHQTKNDDIRPGAWRPVNLQLSPFFFPAPVSLIDDGDANPDLQDYGKSIGLWRLSDVAKRLPHESLAR